MSVCGLRWLGRVSSSWLGKICLERLQSVLEAPYGRGAVGASQNSLPTVDWEPSPVDLDPSPDAGDFPVSHEQVFYPKPFLKTNTLTTRTALQGSGCQLLYSFPGGSSIPGAGGQASRTIAEGLASICSLEQKIHYQVSCAKKQHSVSWWWQSE